MSYRIAASPDQVWAVLADPQRYPDWVVGARAVRGVDGDWPEPGARLHHRSGSGPLEVADHTEVVASEPARRLELQANLRPVGRARVELVLRPDGDGTLVEMSEWARSPAFMRRAQPLVQPLFTIRNRETLRRLGRLAAAL